MAKQAKNPSPPPPIEISATLRGLKPGGTHLFPLAKGTSVRALTSRIGTEMHCTFVTRTEKTGVRVWRKEAE